MGVLDIIHGRTQIRLFLKSNKNLGTDLEALRFAVTDWDTKKLINVGESGTLYRFLQFASWKLRLDKKFIKKGTLRKRKINSDSEIVNYSLDKLLELDNGTSQWASASVLLGNTTKLKKIPYKLDTTYKALQHWKRYKPWISKYDETIEKQAKAFLQLLHGQKLKFKAIQAEDFCFAYVFGLISLKEAEKGWPSLRGHESNRISEARTMLAKAKVGKTIDSKDHRVIQALVMWGAVNNKKIVVKYPQAVNKSWPLFWEFIQYIQSFK